MQLSSAEARTDGRSSSTRLVQVFVTVQQDRPAWRAHPSRARSALTGRAFWITADQAVSSMANAALSIVIANRVSAIQFGAFALAFSVYSLVVALTQSVGAQPVVVRYAASGRSAHSRASGAAAGLTLLIGTVTGVLVAVISLFLDMSLRGSLAAVAVLLPALVLQDLWRSVFISRGTPRQAFANDLLWALLQVAFLAALVLTDSRSAAAYVLAWGLAALVAAVVGVAQSGVRPQVRGAVTFLLDHREVSLPGVANAAAILGATQLAFVLIASLGSVQDVGALRAAQTLLGPLNILGFAVSSFAIPEVVRRDLGRKGLLLVGWGMGVLLLLVDLTWGGVLVVMPEAWGRALLGQSWQSGRDALPGMIAFTAVIGLTAGTTAIMRATNRAVLAFWTSALLGPLVIVGSVIGVLNGGAAGAAWGFAAAAGLSVVPCGIFLARAARLGPYVRDQPAGTNPPIPPPRRTKP